MRRVKQKTKNCLTKKNCLDNQSSKHKTFLLLLCFKLNALNQNKKKKNFCCHDLIKYKLVKKKNERTKTAKTKSRAEI